MPRYVFAITGTPFLNDPSWLEELPDDDTACTHAAEVAWDMARTNPDRAQWAVSAAKGDGRTLCEVPLREAHLQIY